MSELSAAARAELVAVARRAVEASVSGRAFAPGCDLPELKLPRGAFVTIRRRADGELRGCIGQVEPSLPTLAEVVAWAAAAASRDPRFPEVVAAELPGLGLEVSVLSLLTPIRPEAVEVGRHGLLVRCGGRSGLLLPQVATEYGWGRERFLEQTCRKAGLPASAWQRPDCQLVAFTATVFGEGEPRA